MVEKASSRLRVLALLIALMFIALTTRLWFLQVLAAQGFEADAKNNSARIEFTNALRGQIYDANGRPLVMNNESLELRITPSELGDQGEAVILRVSKLTGVEPAAIAKQLQSTRYLPTQAIPVAEFVSKKAQWYVRENPERFPGVEVVDTAVRTYPQGSLAAHILGFTGLIQGDQYEALKAQGYGLNDIVGQAGLESVYEKYLRGTPGKTKLIVNSDGDLIRTLGSVAPVPGDDLRLSLDVRVQTLAQQALLDGMAHARATMQDENGAPLKANAGSVVVLDANTGGVVAMVTTPTFNPSWYVHGLTDAQAKYLFHNKKASPSTNRAIQAEYTPGSTFKSITALAAVKEGIASLSGNYECTPSYTKSGDKSGTVFNNWTTANLGYMTISHALAISCDTVFDAFGGAFYDRYVQNALGTNSDVLARDLRQWGFGQPTGIDLPGEYTGLVPDPAWAATATDSMGRKLFPYGWVPGGDILTMIGSGYIQVTPLQLARGYMAIANGGHLCQPHIVDEIVPADERSVKKVDGNCDQTIPYTPQQLGYIRDALHGVVSTGGTAACAFSGFPTSQIAVAGKTGTAERPPAQDTSWFVAMVGPDPNKPDYVIVTSVEQAGFGGSTAAPITRKVIDALYPDLQDTAAPNCDTPDR
jgi:penicillin-binding protein 2